MSKYSIINENVTKQNLIVVHRVNGGFVNLKLSECYFKEMVFGLKEGLIDVDKG